MNRRLHLDGVRDDSVRVSSAPSLRRAGTR